MRKFRKNRGFVGMKKFLEKKNVRPSVKLYLNDALSAMALGLFSSLLIGLILKTLGEQLLAFSHFEQISNFLIEIGTIAMGLMGAAVGASVAWSLAAPPLVLFSALVMGQLGANSGGPAGAFIVALIATEIGKLVSKETKADIIVTPAVSIIVGGIFARIVAPALHGLMIGLGDLVMSLTKLHPIPMGIAVAVVVGLVLTAPISSAALCIMLNLSGIAAGAATVGCCAQMIGFAVAGIKENSVGATIAQAVGTSMIQLPNIIKNPWIL
ncbi:MAG: PTS transporter subunit IIC, partial [Eubacteriales bacterium]